MKTQKQTFKVSIDRLGECNLTQCVNDSGYFKWEARYGFRHFEGNWYDNNDAALDDVLKQLEQLIHA